MLNTTVKELGVLERTIVSCQKCPRLRTYSEEVAHRKKREFMDWDYWGKPLPGFGDPNARLLIIGLAPAAHGGCRTGRIFCGDSSGNTLMRAMHAAGFASKPFSRDRNDGLALEEAYLTAVVRCAPPDNVPTKGEIENCNSYLIRELQLLRKVSVVIALGNTAFKTYLQTLQRLGVRLPKPLPKFMHGAKYSFEGTAHGRTLPVLISSYHPSRQNTSTGRLTQEMLNEILATAHSLIKNSENRSESGASSTRTFLSAMNNFLSSGKQLVGVPAIFSDIYASTT